MKPNYISEEFHIEETFSGGVISIGICDGYDRLITFLTLDELIKLKEQLEIIISNETTKELE